MRLFDRLRISREAMATYRAAVEQGKEHDECCDVVCETMHEKYGASLNWAKILEIVLMILAMLKKPVAVIALAALAAWGSVADARQVAPAVLAPPPPAEQASACGPGGCLAPSGQGSLGASRPRALSRPRVLSRLLPRGRDCGPGGCGRGIFRRR